MNDTPIGFFDSGVGGLSIWRAATALLPGRATVYLADTAFAPYGERRPEQIIERACRATAFLIGAGASVVVVACNTATVHALAELRRRFPAVPFVGVVPVVKVLAEQTRTGVVAVLATPSTAASPYLSGLIRDHAKDAVVQIIACAGLAEAVERGEITAGSTRTMLERLLAHLPGSGADLVGLGCTHYPFLAREISRVLGPDLRLIDPAQAVARRISSLIGDHPYRERQHATPEHRFVSTGNPARFGEVAELVLGRPIGRVDQVAL